MPRLRLRRASRLGLLVVAICACSPQARAANDAAQPSPSTVTGILIDDSGAAIGGAAVTLTIESGEKLETTSAANGRFSFANVPPGSFQLAVDARGFAERTVAGRVAPGEAANLGDIRLRLTTAALSVDVTPSVVELADRQIEEQQQQRVFGVVPNFYVSFIPDAAPMNLRQKVRLSWKARTDPMQFAFVAAVAGIQQRRHDYPGFGDGASGYAKRYAAAYATAWTRTLIGQALMPAVLHQDPRYFYKGTGTRKARVIYALSRSVVRKGDNGRWQPNYSGILGSLASGAVANLYYPSEDRRDARLTLQNTAIGIAGSAASHIAQEFLFARMTTRGRHRDP